MRATRFSKLLVKGSPASEIPLQVKQAPSQTGKVLQIVNSADAEVWSILADGLGGVRYAEVSITNAEIKALRATPKVLVAAPGTGKVLEFISAVLFHDYGSNALTESTDNMAVRYTDGSGTIVSQAIEAGGFVDATADTMTNVLPKIDAASAKSVCENAALVLHNTGDGEYGGNAGADTVWRAKIAYRVHQTGW